VTSVDTSWLIISTCATSVALLKATGEIHRCWYDEIAALAIFQTEKILHPELHMLNVFINSGFPLPYFFIVVGIT
jgi:hypothetical protein